MKTLNPSALRFGATPTLLDPISKPGRSRPRTTVKKNNLIHSAVLGWLFAAGTICSTLTASAQLSFQYVLLDSSYYLYERDVGDIDGDGDNDIVGVQEGDTNLQVFRAPTWTRSTLITFTGTYRYPRADDFKLADINGDGKVDVVTRLGSGPTDDGLGIAVWCENLGGGTFTQHVIGNSPTYVKDIVVADFDGDGRKDVAMRMDSQAQLWFQEANGSWTQVLLNHPAHEGMAAGDLNGDGHPDIILNGFWFPTPNTPAAARIAANYIQKTIDTAWWNQGGDWTADSAKVVVGDFDGDGIMDVAFSDSERAGYAVTWYRSSGLNGAGPWVAHPVTVVDYCHNLQAVDFNLDGKVDLLVGGMIQSQQRGLKVMVNGGGGTSWTPLVIQTDGSYSAELGDIDNDGDLDIIGIRNWDSGPTYIYRNNSASSGDTTRPTITSVTAVNSTGVQVLFSEPVTSASAQTTGNFSLNNGATVSSASLGADTRTVTLTTSTLAGGSYTLTVNNVADRATPANPIVANSQATFSFTPSDTTRPTITSVTAVNANSVQIMFSEPVTTTTSQAIGNYSINNGVTDSAAVLGADTRSVTLTTSTLAGGSYTLTVNNVADRATPPNPIVANSQMAFSFTPAGDTTPPTAPANLTGNGTSTNIVQLTWQAASDNVGVTQYLVSRNGTLVATLPGTQTSYQDAGLTAATTYAYSIAARDAAGNTSTPATVSVTTQSGGGSTAVVRLNAGGGAFVDDAGNTWSADFGFNTGLIASYPSAISRTGNDPLYQSERYGVSASPELAYTFTLPNGDYTVNLHFAEIYSGTARVGARVFDVLVESQSRIVKLDIFSQVGANAALIISLPVTVNDGQLNIAFVHGVENPKISAIEVLGNAASTDTTRPTITSVTAVNSTSVQIMFSEPVTTTTSQALANYSINNGVTISGAVLGADTRTVTLTTSTLAGGSYTLTVNNVTDRATPANPIVANSQTAFSFTPTDTTRPTITSVTAMNGNSVQLLFSEPVTTTSSQALANYSINNGVTDSAAVLGADTRTVTLTTSTLAGGSYALTVNNVTDRATPANTIVANSQATFSFTPADTTRPTITSVTAVNANSVQLLFSEPVTTASAQTSANYGLDNGATISTAVLGADTRTVTLTSSALAGNYTLTVNNIADRATPANTIVANSQAGFSFTPITPPTGMIAHWRFDEGAGSSAADSSGYGRTGTLVNGAGWAAGQTGSAVNLDGINDHVSLPNLDVVGSRITLAAWVNMASLPTSVDARIISKANNSSESGHWWLLSHTFNGSHRLRFRLKTGGVATTLVASSGNLTANTWFHAAATYDGATMRLYLNGVQVGSTAKTGVIDVNPAVAVNLGRNPEGSNYLPGRLDEVRIYERGLSQAEVQQVMNDSSGLTAPSASMVSAAPVPPYDQWQQHHFAPADLADSVVSGDACDPDADRINNLMEYALGLDPKVADMEGRPVAQIENGLLALTHTRNIAATDVLLIVEAAPQLAGPWSAAGLASQVIKDDGAIQTVKVTDSVAVGTAKSRFLRLTVQLR